MAVPSLPVNATSEFFINLQDNPSQDGSVGSGCSVFGRVVAGLEVLEGMGAEPTASATITDQQGCRQGLSDVSINPIVLLHATETDGL